MIRLCRFNLPLLWLCLCLQRMPALRLASATGATAAVVRTASLLPSAAALGAALGSVHALAGATAFVTTTEHVDGTVGTRILPVAFTLVGAPTPVLSFRVTEGSLPPGLAIAGESRGVVNAALQTNGLIFITGTPTAKGSYSISFDAYAEFNATSSTYGSLTITFTIAELAQPVITAQPAGAVAAGGTVTLAVADVASPGPGYQWTRNGDAIADATGPIYALTGINPDTVGLYSAIASNAEGSTTSEPAIVGVATAGKVIGAGVELQSDIRHPTGNTFDQVLLTGAAAAITSDHPVDQITRLSFIDLTDDIVQVEFSGPGTLSIVLDGASGPGLPVNYVQDISYMKGHAGIVIVGATRDTHVSVFSVGQKNAVNPALFKDAVAYDGVADIAFIAISSTDGEFGGVRAANVTFFAPKGLTGLYAPGVVFNGPVYIGDISASAAATPVLVLGEARGETLITGGDLFQANDAPVKASGLTRLQFAAGSDCHGRPLTAKANRATILQADRDVTSEVVVSPTP